MRINSARTIAQHFPLVWTRQRPQRFFVRWPIGSNQGVYLLQSAGILSRAEEADYQMTYFTLEFHQKKEE